MIKFVLENFDTIFRNEKSLESLNKIILDLAIRGKLVEQNPEDEPASELLKRIKEEKERLIKEKVIKKEKELPKIEKDEIPFEIPESWEWVRLGEILNLLTDGAHKTPKYVEDGVPFLSVKNMSNGKLNFDDIKYITQEEHIELSKRCNIEYGDLLLTKVGTTGVPVIVDTYREFNIFVSVALLKFNKNCIDVKFLRLLLQSPFVYNQSQENTKGVGNKNWVLKDISNTKIILPPLAEQQRIVEKVERLQGLIKNLKEVYLSNEESRLNLKKSLLTEIEKSNSDKELLKNLELVFSNFDKVIRSKEDIKDIRNLILSLAIKGKLVEQNPEDEPASELLKRIKEEKERLIKEKVIKKEKELPKIEENEIPFEIPESWEWVRLENIILKIKYGYTASAKSKGEIKLLRITDIQNNSVEWENVPYCDISLEEYESYKLEERDILIARTGGTVGKTFLITNISKKLKSVYASYLINIKPSVEINENYLKKYFDTTLYWELIKNKSQGTGQPNVNAPSLKSLIIPLSPLAEQQRIVERVEKLMSICDMLEEKIVESERVSEKLLESLVKYEG